MSIDNLNNTTATAGAVLAALMMASPAWAAYTLTADPSALSITEEGSGGVTFTFTNDLADKINIKHINLVSVISSKTCGDDCIIPFFISDGTHRLLDRGQSYSFSLTVNSIVDAAGAIEDGGFGTANIKASVWTEVVSPTHLQGKTVTMIPATVYDVTAPGAPSPRSVNSAVPEPASWALMLIGVGVTGGRLRERGKRVCVGDALIKGP